MPDFPRPSRFECISKHDEAELVRRIKSANQEACTQMVAFFTPRLMAVARRFLDCDEDCKDVVQEAYISAFKGIGRFEGNSRLSTWLHRITVNCCLMRLRSSSRDEEPLVGLPSFLQEHVQGSRGLPDRNPPAELEIVESRQIVRQAINRLPVNYREVVLLRDIEELDTTDTAARLRTSPGNVKRRLHHARQSLHAILESMMGREAELQGNHCPMSASAANCI